MPKLTIVDQTNASVGEVELSEDIFGVEVKPEILNLVVRAQRAAKRAGTHATKNRAVIRGGGKKPWRQKGTGRARAGTTRSPIWRGGAVVFGPQPRDYSFKVNKKVRKLAMKMALSSRVARQTLTVVKDLRQAEIKTKNMVKVAGDLGLKKALIVVAEDDNNLALSARNIPGLTVTTGARLSVYEILRHPQLVLDEAAVAALSERLSA